MSGRILSSVVAVAVLGCADAGPAPYEPETQVLPVFSHSAEHDQANFRTHMTGAEEVPARDTRGQGQSVFQLSEDGTELRYQLMVANIQNVTQAHIHMGPRDGTGGIVVWLYPDAPPAALIPGRSQGVLGQGVITDEDVVGALAGQGVAGLMEQIRAGNTYVNVHTNQFPPGEIRGQLD